MKKEIKCETCNEVMGTIEKDEILPFDESLYQQMSTCINGHNAAKLENIIIEEQQEEIVE